MFSWKSSNEIPYTVESTLYKNDVLARPEEVEHLNGISLPCEYSRDKNGYEVNSDIIYRQNKDAY